MSLIYLERMLAVSIAVDSAKYIKSLELNDICRIWQDIATKGKSKLSSFIK